ncbi:hypothetical protein MKZ38_009804 [Zalerion maritima]|uniref:Golgi apparatus membrane protein TVP38 n=1 Tax=Zalerion maritima TaxID=339359 RepID=A0AAD5RZX6_9PEZI|nr:hypothetical protein MKZ38_009804 [Zalerion maritima]
MEHPSASFIRGGGGSSRHTIRDDPSTTYTYPGENPPPAYYTTSTGSTSQNPSFYSNQARDSTSTLIPPTGAATEAGRLRAGSGASDLEGQQKEEEIYTEYKSINWKKLLFTKKYIPWHLLAIAILVATVLVTVYHDDIVDVLTPFSEKVRDIPAGWLIPIIILIIISFPPLFGHEIIAVLVGVVYGLWEGFGIVAAGTFIGEIATWFAFKYLLKKRAMKMERTNLNYGALARLTRDGGFLVVLVIRLSIVPSHFSTAVFSCCNVKFWHFAVATFLSLPKQLILVYVGVLLTSEGEDDGSMEQNIVFAVAFAVTIVLGIWIWWKMRAVKKVLLEEQEQRKMRKGYEMQAGLKREEEEQREWVVAREVEMERERERQRQMGFGENMI